jgi:hypothetical protein
MYPLSPGFIKPVIPFTMCSSSIVLLSGRSNNKTVREKNPPQIIKSTARVIPNPLVPKFHAPHHPYTLQHPSTTQNVHLTNFHSLLRLRGCLPVLPTPSPPRKMRAHLIPRVPRAPLFLSTHGLGPRGLATRTSQSLLQNAFIHPDQR